MYWDSQVDYFVDMAVFKTLCILVVYQFQNQKPNIEYRVRNTTANLWTQKNKSEVSERRIISHPTRVFQLYFAEK
jgi:hypothetical protein